MAGLDVNALREKAGSAVKSFTPQQLTMLGVMAVIAVVGGMMFLRWVSTPTYGVLYSGLDEKDASKVVEELEATGVAYKLESGGTTILVPESKVYDTRLALSASGVPSGGVVGYELMDKQGFTTSEFRQRVDYQRALEGELTRTLIAIEGVESAAVHLAIPEESLFTDDQKAARASVLLHTSGELGDETVQGVVNLVASSVPDLTPENVTVADDKGHVLSAPGGGGGAVTDRQMRHTETLEAQKAAEAETMLAQAFGAGHAVVRVSADVNFDESEQQTESYDPESQVAVRESTATETFTGTGSPPGGVLGVDGTAVESGGSDTNYEKNETSTEFGVNRTVTTAKSTPGAIERLTVAVLLDGSAKPVPDREQVEQLVAAAVGLDPERGDSIVVDTMAFDATLAESAEKARSSAASAESKDQLMSYVQTGVGVLLLLLVAFFLRKGLKGTKVEPIELPETGPGSLAAALAAAQPAGAAGLPAPMPLGTPAGDSPVPAALVPALVGGGHDDMLQLIDQQPEEVAVLLRSWLADRRG